MNYTKFLFSMIWYTEIKKELATRATDDKVF